MTFNSMRTFSELCFDSQVCVRREALPAILLPNTTGHCVTRVSDLSKKLSTERNFQKKDIVDRFFGTELVRKAR